MDRVIMRLKRLNYLPAIWFILSRKDCDLNAIKAGSAGALTTPEEMGLIETEVEALR
jgi:superfamily II RNA helicase